MTWDFVCYTGPDSGVRALEFLRVCRTNLRATVGAVEVVAAAQPSRFSREGSGMALDGGLRGKGPLCQ